MKLDRNINPDRSGKYALVKRRLLASALNLKDGIAIRDAYNLLCGHGIIDEGTRPDTEFFVIRLRDKYAAPALATYADEASIDDTEYGREISALARRAANHPNQRKPD